ncbi:hypothetical protein M011DRAFT_441294 [Sporormia fimetaria CBS 119925]|uniref:Monopolin complex subunit Csm1/Pcs1 C-terminal domain-containing protein n=1 Tax=Sporormia fimetaria CBS 119925 TaxID=1340428 RepID=A0A6A6VGE9_9PLEO|nr:hypothetical protein M011DRAFT_441294 [Sporormia fimetaria CBS 119925]
MARDTFPTPDSNSENKAPARKARGRPAKVEKPATVTKTTAKSKGAARSASVGKGADVKQEVAATKKKTARGGRKVVEETQEEKVDDADEFDSDEEDVLVAEVKPVKRGRPARAKNNQEVEESVAEIVPPPKRGRKAAQDASVPKPAAKGRTKRIPKAEPEPDMTIPETQPLPDSEPEPMDIEESIEVEEIPESMPPPPRPSARRPIQPLSRTARQPSAGARRAGSVSDTERDPMLRRKVGDLTRKLEAMTTKYENIKEIATSQKESNFDQLRRQTDQTIKNQDAVIKSLKQQISEMQSRSSESAAMKKELAKLKQENEELESENQAISESLEVTQKENKTLTTKLAAARATAAEPKTVPGSAVKARPTSVVLPGAAEAAKEAQLKQRKIDLYSDLTNLVIVGVKKGEDGEDVYDCLQTGRNGTLHFQLSISNDEDAYEDAQFAYTPQLDEKRDAQLYDLLPDYLTEPIEFPRNQVARFYEKILDSMTKKIELIE